MQLPPPRSAFRVLLALAVPVLLLAGCGADSGQLRGAEPETPGDAAGPNGVPEAAAEPSDAGDGPLVVATTSILGDVVANVVGDEGTVEVLMPAGVDPHGYQPSAADAALLREADLVVAVGLDLEENLVDVIAAAEEEGVRVLSLAERLDPIGFAQDHTDEGDPTDEDDHADEDDHGHGPLDPHVWFDPVRMADGTTLIAEELMELADGGWEARAQAYAEELRGVHAELEQQFAALPEDARKLVTNHDSLGYLAHRYDFEILGTVVPGTSTQAEADARAFAALVETIERAEVPAIFTENIEAAALADQLANEVSGRGGEQVAVVSLYTDALGEPGSGAESYLGLLRENARRITEALG